jgi:ABC-type Co2+ transport system permease subunit
MNLVTNALASQVLQWVLPVILGPVVYYIARWALNASDAIDNLPAVVKRAAVVAIGGALTTTLAYLHVDIPSECAALANAGADIMTGAVHACALALNTKVPLQALTAAAVAFVIHSLKKQRPNA